MRDRRFSFSILALIACLALASAMPVYAAAGPSITNLYIFSGPVGAQETIYGSNFGSTQGSSTVTFNGTPVTTVDSWSATLITVIIPAGATTGNIVVKVSGRASNGMMFTVVPPPVIDTISPSSGPIGTSVTITGSNFGATQGGQDAVYFNGYYAGIVSWSDTSIVATAPAAPTGNVYVQISGVQSNGVLYTGWPYIKSVSPTVGPAGTSVTITGFNFGDSQNGGAVTFNGTQGTIANWSSTAITANAPPSASTGNIVVTANGEASNGITFVVGTPSTAPYHLDHESGWLSGTDLLSSAGPDSSSTSIQSADLKGSVNGAATSIEAFSTQSVVPGYIAAGTTINFSLWMSETSSVSGLYPYVSAAYLDLAGDVVGLCSNSGSTALTTTPTELQVNCSIGVPTTLGTGNRLYVQVSVINSSGGSLRSSVMANLYLGGTLNGQYDSQVTIPEIIYPYILSATPATGSAGDSVTIAGGNFGASQGSSTVTFNGVAGTPSTWSDSSIAVPVPTNATTGPLIVTVANQNSNPETFTIPATITSVSPAVGPVGTAVTISGSGFGSTQVSSVVSFNGIPAAPTSWSSTTIVAPVPVGATTGPISVTVSGVVGTGGNFTVTPLITAIAPSVGAVGSSVRIRGYNFGTTQGIVTFSGVQSSLGSWLDGSIVAMVPPGASTGPVIVSVGGFSSNQVNFAVTPSVGAISPNSGSAGTVVTISGSNFGSAQGSSIVMFNGVPASPTSWSNTSITVAAPAGVLTGPVTVVSGGASSNGVPFSVVPSIQSLSPNSGTAGESITITGNGFGPTQGSSWVEFAGTLASPTSWSNTKIVTPVPAAATSGQVVVDASGQQSNGMTFTVGSGSISGTVSDSNGAAIAGASIEVLQNKQSVATGTTATDGTYSIRTLQPGTFDVTASASGYGTSLSSNQSVNANATTTVNFSLSPPGTIAGKVTQSDGVTGIAGASVTASQNGDVLGTATTDSSGSYSLSSLSAGTYNATASDAGYAPQTQDSLAVSTGASTPANFSLSAESVITYTYDQDGRLVGASDSLGNTAVYQYDAVGNLLSIGRNSTSQTSIIAFSPTSAPVGTTVTISGTAFSSDSSQDSVSFNGSAATITSASSTQLVVTVPSGATTGTISVTAPSGTAASTQTFTVTSGSSQPTITSFTPGSGVAGTAVTISGTGFDSNQADDDVTFNLSPATVSSVTGTSIATFVPPASSSGRISVRTKNGTATSSQDFYVPFGTYTASQIGFTGRMAMNSTQTVSIGTAGSIGLMLFDGVAGQSISIFANNSSFSSCNLVVIDPHGQQIGSAACTGSSQFLGGLTLAYSGTYTIGIDPRGTTGSVSVNLNGFSDIAGILPFDSPTTITTTYPGQSAMYTFGGTAGQVVSLAATNNTYPCQTMRYSIVAPGGSTLASLWPCSSSSSLNNLTLPTSGTYTLLVNPGSATGSATFTLTQNITEALSANTPLTVSNTLAGQTFDLTFSGTAGEVVSLAMTNDTYACQTMRFSIVDPDGTTLASSWPCGATASLNNETLPQTGTYTVLVNSEAATGSATFTLTQNITEALSANTPLTVSNTLAGQTFDLTFSGTAGEVVSLAMTNDTYACQTMRFSIVNPDGTTLASSWPCGATASLNNETLPQTGTYTVLVNSEAATGSATFTLTQNITEALSANTPLTVSNTLAGQTFDLTFSGTAGEVVSLAMTNDTYACQTMRFSIVNPDGTTLASSWPCGATASLNNETLPQTGTYTVLVNSEAATGSATFTLTP